MTKSKALGSLILTVSLTGLAHAGDNPPEFSAKVVQERPNQSQSEWRVYAGRISGQKAVRTESEYGGQSWAQITFPKEGRQVMMNLDQQTYQKHALAPRSGPSSQTSEAEDQATKGPCPDHPRVRCRNLGKETVRGRDAVKWQVLRFEQNRPMRWLVWVDQEREYTLRRVGPNGSYMEQWLAAEDVTANGRKTEKWKTLISRPNGQIFRSVRWFDPELGMTIKEKRPDDSVRELKDIEVTEQPDKLFRIPDAFEPAFAKPGPPEQGARQPAAER